MPAFRFLHGPLRTPLARLVAAMCLPSRWLLRARLLDLSLVLAGQSSRPLAAQPQQPAPATGAVFTLSIDGEKVPAHSFVLSNVPRPAVGFVLGIEAAQTKVQLIGSTSAPLAVGKYDVIDNAASGVTITAGLLPRFQQELEDPKEGFHSHLIDFRKGHEYVLYDWGEGPQKLHGRKLGQVVFTRVSSGTADGSFQSTVYGVLSRKIMEWEEVPRPFIKLRGHELRGTFKDLPINNVSKAMNDLKDISETMRKLAPPVAKPPH